MFHPVIGYHAYVYKGMRSTSTSRKKERKTPTDGLDVRSQVWMRHDHSEGKSQCNGKGDEGKTRERSDVSRRKDKRYEKPANKSIYS